MAYSILNPAPNEQNSAASDQATLALADDRHIVAELARAKARGAPPWLSAGHPFQDGSLPRNKTQFLAVSDSAKIETMSVLGPLHLADGWRYFSRGLSAMLSGDAHAAKHLAYYSEMRAGLSLLASAGIGLFGQHNVVVDSSGKVHDLTSKSSHEMCWAVLEQWVTQSGSVEALLSAVDVNGAPLMDLLRTYFASPSAVHLGSKIMDEWGFDLSQGSVDREERNNSSYNPSALSPLSTSPDDDHEFLTSLWQSFEPSSALLERHLFRKLLHIEHSSVLGAPLSERVAEYDRLDERAKRVMPADFLTSAPDGDDELYLLKLAKDRTTPVRPSAMLARASLLLALAGGKVHQNFQRAGIDALNDLENWWDPLGLESGCWRPEERPEVLSDLWDDIELALEFSSVGNKSSRLDWQIGVGDQMCYLFGAERIAIWGICR